uniref:CUB domain-containing protein n=1 Tax=Magallana gigas TaxID=29159 RepID=A0A8W8P477_MAGGI
MELKSYTACYGILGNPNFLLPSCPAGQKIAVMAVYTLAKYKSTGCPKYKLHRVTTPPAVSMTSLTAHQAVDPCTDLTTSDSPAFFWNTGYPAEMTTINTSCTCSIEMSCDTTVELTAIDLQLKDPGNCKHSLLVTDGSFSSTYDCSSNNDFLPRVMYTSTSHFVTIVFTNNLGIIGGNKSYRRGNTFLRGIRTNNVVTESQ